MQTAKKILWITPKWLLPANDGATKASCTLLKNLNHQNFSIDLLSFYNQAPNESEILEAIRTLGVSRILLTKRKNIFGKLSRLLNLLYSTATLSSLPFTFLPYRKNIDHIIKAQNSASWDYLVFDGLHSAVPFFSPDNLKILEKSKLIYRAHNVEMNLWGQTAAQSSFLKRLVVNIQTKKVKKFEAKVLELSSGLATVSDSDLNFFKALYQIPKSKVVPIGLDFEQNKSITRTKAQNLNLLFIGSIAWKPNRDGINWFLKNVWPQVLSSRKDIFLSIIGKTTDAFKAQYSDLKNVKILGQIEDLNSLYAQVDATIIPIFSGSGTRVKAIEAASFRLACISTKLGVEGLGLSAENSYLQAESQEDWIKVLSKIQADDLHRIGENAFTELAGNFDQVNSARAFEQLLMS